MSVLIKNALIVNSSESFLSDIYIEQEKIKSIGINLSVTAAEVIDAKGTYAIPGGVDVHTHLDMPFGGTKSADDFETGTIAAAVGGTTTIVDYAMQDRTRGLLASLETWKSKASNAAAIDYGFHMIISDFSGNIKDEMRTLVKEGITSFKVFTAYPGVLMLNDSAILNIMQYSKDIGALICVHAENGFIISELVRQSIQSGNSSPRFHALTRPSILEGEAVNRVTSIAEIAKSPVYLVHLSSNDALREVVAAKNRGVKVFAETCPQYLILSDESYLEHGFCGAKYVMSPPLRDKSNWRPLWEAVSRNDLQVISTDHCPFNFKEQKELGLNDFSKIPNGAPGIENRVELIYSEGVVSGEISINKWVDVVSVAPSKIFGMFPRKGSISPGADADVVLFDPNKNIVIEAKNQKSNVDYSMYEGKILSGSVKTVISRGETIVKDRKFIGKKGRGRFIKRNSSSVFI